MSSIARHQFPIIAWREQKKLLWNPIHKNTLKDRPEERVRLRIIDFLIQAGWSRHRISTEEAVKGDTCPGLRTDIICYSRDFEPRILVECKAENISLTGQTALQVGRYNREVNAPYVLLTNGRQDYWYHVNRENSSVNRIDGPPAILPDAEPPARDFTYWMERGFVGKNAGPDLRSWLLPLLRSYAGTDTPKEDNPGRIRYLQFERSPTDTPLDHYYHIAGYGSRKIALSFLSTPSGGTRLIAISNREGKNEGVADIDMDRLFRGEQSHAALYSAAGRQGFDPAKEGITGSRKTDGPPSLQELSAALHRLFRNHLA